MSPFRYLKFGKKFDDMNVPSLPVTFPARRGNLEIRGFHRQGIMRHNFNCSIIPLTVLADRRNNCCSGIDNSSFRMSFTPS